MGISSINNMGRPQGSNWGSTLSQHQRMIDQQMMALSGIGSAIRGDPYAEQRKLHGDELVNKWIKVKNMSIEEFSKSEFYRSLLNE